MVELFSEFQQLIERVGGAVEVERSSDISVATSADQAKSKTSALVQNLTLDFLMSDIACLQVQALTSSCTRSD